MENFRTNSICVSYSLLVGSKLVWAVNSDVLAASHSSFSRTITLIFYIVDDLQRNVKNVGYVYQFFNMVSESVPGNTLSTIYNSSLTKSKLVT